jgi:hypothetical protein
MLSDSSNCTVPGGWANNYRAIIQAPRWCGPRIDWHADTTTDKDHSDGRQTRAARYGLIRLGEKGRKGNVGSHLVVWGVRTDCDESAIRFTLSFPADMSADSYADLKDHLELFLRKAKRRAESDDETEKKGAAN